METVCHYGGLQEQQLILDSIELDCKEARQGNPHVNMCHNYWEQLIQLTIVPKGPPHVVSTTY